MSLKLVGVRKDEHGNITHFLTDRETVLTIDEAKQLAREGGIDTLSEIQEDGSWVIDDAVQHMEGNNLADLPEF